MSRMKRKRKTEEERGEKRKRQVEGDMQQMEMEVGTQDVEKKQETDPFDEVIDPEFEETDEKPVKSRKMLALDLSIAIRSKCFATVEGPLGCGKTFLVKIAAQKSNLPLRTLQMGDQIDSKSLFGTYQCTEVAGEFRWQMSKFSEWLTEPGLILLEDLDMANADVISLIMKLAEERSASLPSGKVVQLHEDVRIVATICGFGKRNPVLEGVKMRIALPALEDEHLQQLVSRLFPPLDDFAKKLVFIFRLLERKGLSRKLTSTDLLRGCSRILSFAQNLQQEKVLTELVDVWCLFESQHKSLELCKIVADMLQINEDMLSSLLDFHAPLIRQDGKQLAIGRVNLERNLTIECRQRHKLGQTREVLVLMERIAVCVSSNEPVLLVGETGVGKTSVVQALADLLGQELRVVNLSATSDSDELIQGYKPTTIAKLIGPFNELFHDTLRQAIDPQKNANFFENIQKCLIQGRFTDFLDVVEKTAEKILARNPENLGKWPEIVVRTRRIRRGLQKGAVPFALTKGAVLEAAEQGHWLLVDEINLAPPECLDAIVHAIASPTTHRKFRLFACMNPATDSGKRTLPASVRARFTEFFVNDVSNRQSLMTIVNAYLPSAKSQFVERLVDFYLQAKKEYPGHFSLRTLCRALLYTADNLFLNEDRSLKEALCMAFLTNMSTEQKAEMKKKIFDKFRAQTSIPQPKPIDFKEGQIEYIQIEGYWIEKGCELPAEDENYVMTKTVKENMAEIARITGSGRFPILLEGETSAGKTSIVCHLAKITGNTIVRINNHEHTDVQEYMGSYVADSEGRLVFREGPLVRAVKEGSWVILDELNLAPTDVIEALNRLLDDNRELFVAETNQVHKAHRRFRLFATQNPAGTYAGRKRLSRALLSRFIVLKFNHLPMEELSQMVCTRCRVPESASKKMIQVLTNLRMKRSLSGLFSARDGLMTLRDVFRWAKRLSTDETCDDYCQVLANHGYMLLAGRCRNREDELTVISTLETVLKTKIKIEDLFALDSPYMPKHVDVSNLVLTFGMRKMLVLTYQAWLRNEAVLIVGETGGGKTSMAEAMGEGRLLTINCHERTETADLLGRLRPRADGGFIWSDGIVIAAMKSGVPLLIDEISLAEDSVLERLNPLFEEDRTLLLTDAGVEAHKVDAQQGFQIVATMNPGGDYGKKELSKALRNRFTEIWTACEYLPQELVEIFNQRSKFGSLEVDKDAGKLTVAECLVQWIAQFYSKYAHILRTSPSVRDVVACAQLYTALIETAKFDRLRALFETISAVFLDAISSLDASILALIESENVTGEAKRILFEIARANEVNWEDVDSELQLSSGSNDTGFGNLRIRNGPLKLHLPQGFSFKAPTCLKNLYRVIRGMQIKKPILVEGPPGCGKSSSVMALAALTGHPITRLNLSEQTDLCDLFGSDVPVMLEDGSISFRWMDGPVLRAIKAGEWVLLDEMNLASQSILEGLNACFDHRRLLYIAELNRSFEIPEDSECRFFACQNPRAQGGNRRALPKSFINRFVNIHVDNYTAHDMQMIITRQLAGFGREMSEDWRQKLVKLADELSNHRENTRWQFAFNARDLLRWLDAYEQFHCIDLAMQIIFFGRLRGEQKWAHEVVDNCFGHNPVWPPILLTTDKKTIKIGAVELPYNEQNSSNSHLLLPCQMRLLYELAVCCKMKWVALIVGPRNCGKRSTVENLASICGTKLQTLRLNTDTDAQELIGSYEQIIDEKYLHSAREELAKHLYKYLETDALRSILEATEIDSLEKATEAALRKINDEELTAECHGILQTAAQNAMRFEWIDSPFVEAYVKGQWILIEDVNLCSAAVLDRLNCCLEDDGSLVISERQSSFQPIKPHPDFRIFLTMDDRDGEISRAMRNRCVELYVDESERWYSSSKDALAVAGIEATEANVEIISSFSKEEVIQLTVLKEDLGTADAIGKMLAARGEISLAQSVRLLNEQQILEPRPPSIRDFGTESYARWLMSLFDLDDPDALIEDILDRQMLSELAGCVGKVEHPLDPRFHSSTLHLAEEEAGNLKNFVISTLTKWIKSRINQSPQKTDSAMDLARRYSTMNYGEKQRYQRIVFDGMDIVVDFLKKLNDVDELFGISSEANEKKIFVAAFLLAFFISAVNSRPFIPGSNADLKSWLYLAYAKLNSVKHVISSNLSGQIEHFFKTIYRGWSAENQRRFMDKFLPRYRHHRHASCIGRGEEFARLSSEMKSVNWLTWKENEPVEQMEIDSDELQEHIHGDAIAKAQRQLQEMVDIGAYLQGVECKVRLRLLVSFL
ncbi:hypothetical protein WR25_15997 [Diploscapter pachys]|uniref:Midasin n=1 Tax=Diploscapter pachys TaxID=2018661 RepID=A0A2A2L3E5_9BILA|nr:hypothetical protein WR25_15997 [Diploscapter pachys]